MKHFVSIYHKHNYMTNNKLSHFVLLLALLIHAGALHSQSLQTVQKLGVGINGLELAVEIPVTDNITIEPAVGLGPSYDISEWSANWVSYHWAIAEPSVHASVYGKLFYNRDKRMRKGKSMLFNSGKFVGVKIKYVSKPLTGYEYHDMDNTILANLNWGGQRNIGKYWNYSYSVGLGYGYNLDYSRSTFYPAYDFKVAYVLPLFSKK